MEKDKTKEIVSILMESSLYFSFSLDERLKIIKNLQQKVSLYEEENLFNIKERF